MDPAQPAEPTNLLARAKLDRIVYAAAVTLGGGSGLGTIVGHVGHADASSFQRYVVASAAGVMAFGLLVGCVIRIVSGDWSVRPVRRRYVWELGLTTAVAAVAVSAARLPTHAYEAWVFTVLISFVIAVYTPLQRSIKKSLHDHHDRRVVTERIADTNPFPRLFGEEGAGDEENLDRIADDLHAFPPWGWVKWLLTVSPLEPFTRIRVVVVVALIVLFGFQFSVATAETASAVKRVFIHGKPHSQTKRKVKTHKRNTKKRKVNLLRTWQDICGAKNLPGDAAPEWAQQDLFDLYLGENGYGAIQAGCTEPTQLPYGRDGGFVYEIAYKDGELQSVAVDSYLYGPAIYLRPAASIVLDLIRREGPLGGPARANVGGGDYYLIHNQQGTVVLLRDEKHPIGQPRIAIPYSQLPPPVAAAWFDAMKVHGKWLWPEGPVSVSPTLEIYEFVDNAFGGALVEDVELSSETQQAYGQLSGKSGGAWTTYAGGVSVPSASVSEFAGRVPLPGS